MFLVAMLPHLSGARNRVGRQDRPRSVRLALLLAVNVSLVGCGSGDEGASSPRINGNAIGVEGAHEHGVARIGLAVDGMRLTLDLQTPGDAVFGFEHGPETEEERAVVADALDRIRSGAGSLLSLEPALGCVVYDVEILEAPDLTGDEAHDEEEGHDDEAPDADEHLHSEMRARVTWNCAGSPEGTPATLTLAALLPGVESVDLTVITSRGQAAGRVGPDAAFQF